MFWLTLFDDALREQKQKIPSMQGGTLLEMLKFVCSGNEKALGVVLELIPLNQSMLRIAVDFNFFVGQNGIPACLKSVVLTGVCLPSVCNNGTCCAGGDTGIVFSP
ncbi:MAG: hypothetical protein ACFFD4_26530 [Candidatus Odinarchaeota archaeon]